jgi:hypothetical protein
MSPTRTLLAIIATATCATQPAAPFADTGTGAATASSAELHAPLGESASGVSSSASWMVWQHVAAADAIAATGVPAVPAAAAGPPPRIRVASAPSSYGSSTAAPPNTIAAAAASLTSSTQSRWWRRRLLRHNADVDKNNGAHTKQIGVVGKVTKATLDACGKGCVEELRLGNKSFPLFLGMNQSVYRVGDVVLGVGPRWKRDRKSVATSPEFAGSILQTYFKTRDYWAAHDMDFGLLADLCAKMLPETAIDEDLVIHFRNGDNTKWNPVARVGNCAKNFNATHPRTKDDPKLRVRLVTVQHYGHDEVYHQFFPSTVTVQHANLAMKEVRTCVRACCVRACVRACVLRARVHGSMPVPAAGVCGLSGWLARRVCWRTTTTITIVARCVLLRQRGSSNSTSHPQRWRRRRLRRWRW